MRFEGKVAVVTGAASGIGASVARRLAEGGATVVIADVAVDGEKVAADIGGEFVRCDVGNSEQVQSLFSGVLDRHGHLDLLHNNAGREMHAPLLATEDDDYHELVRVNLDGVFFGIKYGAKAMLASGPGGAIVNTASVAGLRGCPFLGAYNASKGGVVLLTMNAALELASLGIRVNAVCPGVVNTPMVVGALDESMKAEALKMLGRGHPMGRVAEPDEIARMATFLLSDEASFVTGQAVAVDGGMTAGFNMNTMSWGG